MRGSYIVGGQTPGGRKVPEHTRSLQANSYRNNKGWPIHQ